MKNEVEVNQLLEIYREILPVWRESREYISSRRKITELITYLNDDKIKKTPKQIKEAQALIKACYKDIVRMQKVAEDTFEITNKIRLKVEKHLDKML